ncbi:MAG TPA: PAS domain S-box protein [Thermodesulfovibrionales bacterium]|nr:PAS domain S-box protein [Thermodesulfovibrionales bacterium]
MTVEWGLIQELEKKYMGKLQSNKKRAVKCWEYFQCGEKKCPAFKSADLKCWLYTGTHCRKQIQGKFLEKIEICLDCTPFKSNINTVSLKDTLKVINAQFKGYQKLVNEREKEIRDISMELAFGAYEVFEALKKISSGNNSVKLNEKSKIELIGKLKQVVNKTAKEIRKSEETMRFTQFSIDHTADAAFWMTPDSRFIYVNKAACLSLGYSKDELLSMTVHDIDRLYSKKTWKDHWQDLKKRKTFTFESLHKAKDGRTFPVELTVNFVEFEGKEYNCAFARDITHRKQIADALEKSEQMFRAISNAAVNAIIVMDNDGKISYWNPAAEKIFGYTSEEAIGKVLHTLLAPRKYRNLYMRGFSRFKETGEGSAVGGPSEFTALRKDGTEFPMEVSTSSVLIGGKWHAVGIVRDITERKRAEEELKKSHDTLRALSLFITELEESEKRRLARELHDLVGQKLTTLNINLDFLVERLSPESKKSIGSMLQDSKVLVKEIMKLIRNVMSNLRPQILDDYGLTAAIYWYTEQFTKRTKIPVVFKEHELKTRLLPDIETNLYRITQEALTNTAKYAHASKVSITVKEENGTVNLSIADDGIGFKPESVHQLKEKRGLGLIGMRERAESIGGKLSVQSTPGKGTNISVEVKR